MTFGEAPIFDGLNDSQRLAATTFGIKEHCSKLQGITSLIFGINEIY